MIINYLRSSWERDCPLQAEMFVSPIGLLKGLDGSNVCIKSLSTDLTLAGRY